jgi:chromate reductase
MKLVGICGSLRKGSYNALALRAAGELLPNGMSLEILDLRSIPFYDEDLRSEGEPAVVTALKAKIRDADAVLIATPEYNFSIPGVLKNALDWLSRAPDAPFDDKVVAIMGASPGLAGTGRVQYDLRKVMVFLNAFVVNKPEVFIREAPSKFDAQGALVDSATREFIAELLLSVQRLARRLHSVP